MTLFSKFLRVLCLCVVLEKGSWSPTRAPPSPAWLKEWTISKGWIHNRSHLLALGASDDSSSSSSISTEDIDELVSLELEPPDISLIYRQMSHNYRDSFPEQPCDVANAAASNLKLPEIYKERMLQLQNDETFVEKLWKRCKVKRYVKDGSYKFTINELYEAAPSAGEAPTGKVSLGRNIALFNTLNAKTNLHEEPIYECDEDCVSVYANPIYAPLVGRFYDFDTNRRGAFTYTKRKTEKYVIRHIRIRIMLSLRVGNIAHKFKMRKKEKKNNRKVAASKPKQESIRQTHEEQRRMGNGANSIKIQNLRYGRLNVLRWLLWEAETTTNKKMPAALEKSATNNTTLALHYAAARGCLDCVRLLVDSSPELSANTQMDNDVTPVYLAAQEGHLEVLKFLVLEAGGSLYVRAKDGMAPIHAASQMGCLNCVKWMIQDQGVDPNLRDGDGATPLHFAASRGHLDTVRWLLKHGARLSLDKYGKSPINDAAENQQVECLNVLVQHGTTPDYKETSIERPSKSCSCTTSRKTDQIKRGNNTIRSDCSSCKTNDTSEPFYLHPPLSRSMEAPHAPQDGLYINPMNTLRHSASSGSESSSNESSVIGDSFYLHNPEEVIYNRVKDLFEVPSTQRPPLSALTVKVEVHSSSSGAGSDENLSSSDLSERSADHDHDYEDIYLVRDETKKKTDSKPSTAAATAATASTTTNTVRSRSIDSGSHSRSGSASSSSNSGCNVVVKMTPTVAHPNVGMEKMKLAVRHSTPAVKSTGLGGGGGKLKRLVSDGGSPPPPPPPLPAAGMAEADDEPRGAEVVEIVEEPTLKPSEIAKGMCRTMSALTASRRLNSSSCSDLTIVSLAEDAPAAPHLASRQRVLPFTPPAFPAAAASDAANHLIKPSEYLRSLGAAPSPPPMTHEAAPPPPPPPAPPAEARPPAAAELADLKRQQQQPLSAISIQDLNSVQLRRTDNKLAKTFSAPPMRSISLQSLQAEPFHAAKIDLIAELKASKDITGIRKMKIERAKNEVCKEKELYSEISKQFTTTKFVEKIPDRDNTGNVIPVWKRQMLAKKAAEKARKELEEQLLKEAEEKRLLAIPQWKRQLIMKKEEAEHKIRSTIYTPKIVDDTKSSKIIEAHECLKNANGYPEEYRVEDDLNNNAIDKESCEDVETISVAGTEQEQDSEEDTNIIPWRAQLRKTNSKLNLLD